MAIFLISFWYDANFILLEVNNVNQLEDRNTGYFIYIFRMAIGSINYYFSRCL